MVLLNHQEEVKVMNYNGIDPMQIVDTILMLLVVVMLASCVSYMGI